ncbi:hypothetical protein NC653_005064 [Populus alba x Populus x berolinensis]|uniref:Glycosyltransferase family 92 protein n=1 Tax=Populus alba x Populus x berolinensis TaxID=444605 RepID=A0AAD6WAM2_9ROSI|nr:hypothetical protein NC653_005064 [Populus alba x Populus x berolinensis]
MELVAVLLPDWEVLLIVSPESPLLITSISKDDLLCLYPNNETTPARFSGEIVGACAMVFDVAKFLREWVVYHSKIGVEKFVLYDNDSDDDLMKVIKELNQEGYSIERSFWIWPKTQEAGRFSHAQ